MKTIRPIIVAAAKGILANPDVDPGVRIRETAAGGTIDVDLRPYDPAPMIGAGGRTKFALQTLIAADLDPASFPIFFNSSGSQSPPKATPQEPSIDPVQDLAEALVRHWTGIGIRADVNVEVTPSGVVAWFTLDRDISGSMQGPLSRIIANLGKAAGFPCVAHVKKAG